MKKPTGAFSVLQDPASTQLQLLAKLYDLHDDLGRQKLTPAELRDALAAAYMLGYEHRSDEVSGALA
jgi:hypothetical protein